MSSFDGHFRQHRPFSCSEETARATVAQRWEDALHARIAPMFSSRTVANTVIVVVLGLQALQFAGDYWVFPFINYPMYSAAVAPGHCVAARSDVYLVWSSGRRERFLPRAGFELSRGVSHFGLSQTTYQRKYLAPMIYHPSRTTTEATARRLMQRINSRSKSDSVLAIEVQGELLTISSGTIVKQKPFRHVFKLAPNDD